MPLMDTYAPGTFCWADLGTPDAAAAKRFYTALFGWIAEDRPMGPDACYTMLTVGGRSVAALYQQEPAAGGTPAQWLSYISVGSVEAVGGTGEGARRRRPDGAVRRARRRAHGDGAGSHRRRGGAVGAAAPRGRGRRRRAECDLLERARHDRPEARGRILHLPVRLVGRDAAGGGDELHALHRCRDAARRNDDHRAGMGAGAAGTGWSISPSATARGRRRWHSHWAARCGSRRRRQRASGGFRCSWTHRARPSR